MYKKITIIAAAFLLSGCPGPADRVPPKHPANVALRDNHVCITAPTQPGEYVSSIQISDGESNNLLKTFDTDPVKVTSGQCLPSLDYDFKKGHTYTAYFTVEKNRIDEAKYFTVEFSVDQNGVQQLTPPFKQ